MTDAETLEGLADHIDACVEDAKRPITTLRSWPLAEQADPRIICLANALSAISKALRASILRGEG